MGTWTTVSTAPPGAEFADLLLSDGTVMSHPRPELSNPTNWYRLTPDSTGNYASGTWSQLAPMHYPRGYAPTAVLADGRAVIAGGEYPFFTPSTNDTMEIYEPRLNTWSLASGWTADVSDSELKVMPDGKMLVFPKNLPSASIYDPILGTLRSTPNKLNNDHNSEETVVKLRDGSYLVADVMDPPAAQKYIPSTNSWVSAGNTPAILIAEGESGPGLVLNDGRVWQLGATNNTAFYLPPANAADPGTWQAGPSFPNGDTADDRQAAVLPSGRVLLETAGPSVVTFYEFDPATNQFAPAPNPPFPNPTGGAFNLLLLPSGEVLAADSVGNFAVYTPAPGVDTTWKPTITSIADNGNGTFLVSGTKLNGGGEGASFGDDAEAATNFPVVRLVSQSGVVRYGKTFDFSSMGIATASGSATLSVPGIPAGTYSAIAVVNGVASDPVTMTISAAAAQCNDGLKNATETDVDCGGSCMRCVFTQHCSSSADCRLGACSPVSQTCSPYCSDLVADNGEGDVDCGAVCGNTCALGQHCNGNSDCSHLGSCASNLCTAYCQSTVYCANGVIANYMYPALRAPLL
jgi:hypothetical protein